MKTIYIFAVLVSLAFTMNASVWADGWIEIDPPALSDPSFPTFDPSLRVQSHLVDIDIVGGFAEVSLKKSFHNFGKRTVEGTFFFPLPRGAYIEDFRVKLNGQELAGEILPAAKAKRIYESLVRRAVDPAILEYYRHDLFRARVFPIPSGESVQVTLAYRQRVPSNGGLTRFTYPLSSGHFSSRELRDLQINVNVKTDSRLHSAHSPSHPCKVIDQSAYGSSLRYSAKATSAQHDFLLDILEGDGQLAAGLRAYREDSEDGWFLLRLVPGQQPQESLPPGTLILLVDVSGSMTGKKIEHAKSAIRSALGRLRPKDRFQILAYSSSVTSFAPSTVYATNQALEAAEEFVENLIAKGGTNIDQALRQGLEAAKIEDSNATVMLITDGRPTVGVTSKDEIVNNSVTCNGGDQRVHVLGMGTDVNTILLDELAKKNRGSRTYIRTGETLEVSLNEILDRALYPAITNIDLAIEGISIDQIEPPAPWDLFHGDELVLAGRYDGSGNSRVTVTGQLPETQLAWSFPAKFPDQGGAEEAAYLWAEFRITTLMESLRIAGSSPRPDIVAEVTELSLRYGIVTPFTSYLIKESTEGAIAQRVAGQVLENEKYRRETMDFGRGFHTPTGEDSFGTALILADQRKNLGKDLSAAGLTVPESSAGIAFDLDLTKVAGRTLISSNDETETLVDTSLGGDLKLPEPDIRYEFLSEDYLRFLGENPGVEKILARGTSILFRWKGSVIKIEGLDSDSLKPIRKEAVRL